MVNRRLLYLRYFSGTEITDQSIPLLRDFK